MMPMAAEPGRRTRRRRGAARATGSRRCWPAAAGWTPTTSPASSATAGRWSRWSGPTGSPSEHVRDAVADRGPAADHAGPPAPGPRLRGGHRTRARPIVLETLPGATLAALVDDAPLGVADTALLGRQLVSVLGYLHRHGWVHLDVKPENVVVQEGRAVLIDLGVATRPGRLERGMGTDGYAAPEQDAGGAVSPATDVWGLGATLAECVTGSGARRRTRPAAGAGRRCGRCWRPAWTPTRRGGRRSTSCGPGSTRSSRPRRRRPLGPGSGRGGPATATMITTDREQQAQPDQDGADDPADPAGVGRAPAAQLTAAGVDLARPPGCPSPRRTARSSWHSTSPRMPEDQHGDRLVVVRRREPAVRRLRRTGSAGSRRTAAAAGGGGGGGCCVTAHILPPVGGPLGCDP